MPTNRKERLIYALITVIITVHAFVFYSVYVINGNNLMIITGENSVMSAINSLGGIYMIGSYYPIWAVILVELIIAYLIEILIGSPLSFKCASKAFDIKNTHPVIFETAIVCATVCIMCTLMSLVAAILYYPYDMGFNLLTMLADWFKLVCYNFPFAFFSQLFFIQPLMRTIFKIIFKKNRKAN